MPTHVSTIMSDSMQQGPQDSVLHILDLDDASLCAVFSWLSARELATVSLVCTHFCSAARSNLLWLQLIQAQFGVALASQAHTQPSVVIALYQRLLRGSSRPQSLPCRAVATDGGCDELHSSTYWVSRFIATFCS